MLALTDAPSVIAATRARSHGVSAAPLTPVWSASRIAWSTASRVTSSGSAPILGHRHADHEAGLEPQRLVGADDGRGRGDVRHAGAGP